MDGETVREDFSVCPPRPDILINSIRSFGYTLPVAISDIIDNSITAESQHIWISYSWNDGEPWIKVTDDGHGMNQEQLFEAMRLGSRTKSEERGAYDLGKFGIGLKTASFSQCLRFWQI